MNHAESWNSKAVKFCSLCHRPRRTRTAKNFINVMCPAYVWRKRLTRRVQQKFHCLYYSVVKEKLKILWCRNCIKFNRALAVNLQTAFELAYCVFQVPLNFVVTFYIFGLPWFSYVTNSCQAPRILWGKVRTMSVLTFDPCCRNI